LISASVAKNVPSRFRIRSDSDKPAHSSKKWKRIFSRDVRLNAVDLVFMIDGKTAPDTYEQDEHYEEKPRRRRAGDRPIESGQSERPAGDLRQRRTH
jgi:hypothetical protein